VGTFLRAEGGGTGERRDRERRVEMSRAHTHWALPHVERSVGWSEPLEVQGTAQRRAAANR
jgi:hypothetical protein